MSLYISSVELVLPCPCMKGTVQGKPLQLSGPWTGVIPLLCPGPYDNWISVFHRRLGLFLLHQLRPGCRHRAKGDLVGLVFFPQLCLAPLSCLILRWRLLVWTTLKVEGGWASGEERCNQIIFGLVLSSDGSWFYRRVLLWVPHPWGVLTCNPLLNLFCFTKSSRSNHFVSLPLLPIQQATITSPRSLQWPPPNWFPCFCPGLFFFYT